MIADLVISGATIVTDTTQFVASIAIKDGEIRIKVGGSTWTFTASGFDQTGGHHKHTGKNTGKDHVHGGIVAGGDNTDVPSN